MPGLTGLDAGIGFVPARGTAGGPITSIVEVAPSAGAGDLVLARPMSATSVATDRVTSFRMPAGTFTHSSADAVVTIEARQADGAALPEWLSFDAASGTFTVSPPEGLEGTVTVKVIARDQNGNEAVSEFTLTIGEAAGDGQAPGPANQQDGHLSEPPAGRPGLSTQLAAAGHSGLVADALAFLEDLLALAGQEGRDHDQAA